ncbi:MAG: penicillin-binding protein activator [Alphaproteobacteria bacterium]
MLLAALLLAALPLAACQPTTVSAPPPGQQAAVPTVIDSQRPPPAPVEPATALAPAGSAAPTLPSGPITVALLLPLSGERAALGHDLLDAATLALFDLARDDLVIVPKDTAGDPARAATAAAAALGEGARLILGPLFAPEVAAVAPAAAAAGVPVVAFSSDRRAASPGSYVFGLAPEDQIDQVVAYALAQGRTRFAALAPQTDTGRLMARAVARVVTERGGRLAQPGFYPSGAIDQSGPVRDFADFATRPAAAELQRAVLEGRSDDLARRARAELDLALAQGWLGYDAVLVPDAGQSLRSVAAMLPFFDIAPPDVQILGTAAWDEPRSLVEPGLAGAWFAAPDQALKDAFAARFRAAFGRQPGPIASLAYDAVALAGALVATAPDAPFATARLTQPSGFAGVDGVFRFLPDGTSQRALAIFRVAAGKAEQVAPAATSFELLTQ